MVRWFLAAALSFGLLAVGTTESVAGTILPGTYELLDHGDGSLGPDYGLRVDDIGAVFSVELGGAFVLLTWDGGNTANISGTVRNNATLELWTVNYDLTDVAAAAANEGFTATEGSGVLTDPLNNDTDLTGEVSGGFVFLFLADGHRIDNDDDSAVGRGWILPPATTDDWLVRARPVPEPSALLLLLPGAIALASYRRRG